MQPNGAHGTGHPTHDHERRQRDAQPPRKRKQREDRAPEQAVAERPRIVPLDLPAVIILLEVDAERVRAWLFARVAAESGGDWESWADLARVLAPE